MAGIHSAASNWTREPGRPGASCAPSSASIPIVGTGTANTGALSTGASYNTNPYNTSAGPGATRETTIVNKAFIQFAGLTAGRAQSMFDFYANAYNYQKIAGSSATTQLIAYT